MKSMIKISDNHKKLFSQDAGLEFRSDSIKTSEGTVIRGSMKDIYLLIQVEKVFSLA